MIRKNKENGSVRSITAHTFIGQLFLEASIGRELWYFTRSSKSRDHRIYHFVHIGVTRLIQPSGEAQTDMLVVSILFLNFKIGWMTLRK